MRVKWPDEEAQDYGPVPEGTYLCRVEKSEAATTRNGDDMWKLTMEVAEGRYKGRQIWDNVVFSEGAMPRAKLMCRCLGLDTEGETDIFPEDLKNRTAYVTVTVEDYVNRDGQNRQRNSVTYGGYMSADNAPPPQTNSSETNVDDDIPFVIALPILLTVLGGLLV